ncbi:hypothetical protein OAQ24_00700 [Flavobacteriaceae bacterium]|nr:hypothetical protein [Flavobacteriaceae bacterium]
MKNYFIAFLLLGTINVWSQQESDSLLQEEILVIRNQLELQSNELANLNYKLLELTQIQGIEKVSSDSLKRAVGNQKSKIDVLIGNTAQLEADKNALINSIDSLIVLIGVNSKSIETNAQDLGKEIQNTRQKSDTQIAELDSDVALVRLYWILGSVMSISLLAVVYILLGKKLSSSKSEVEKQIKNTRVSLEQEGIKLDHKLIEVLETQLKIQQGSNISNSSSADTDHSLALKVADEIIRIQKNLSRMDEETKGLKQLNASVKRIQENFASNGYELVDMLGKEYNEGMKASTSFTTNEDLESGKQIITRVIKPQVNFNGKMIQAAQIEVSVGE